MRNMMIIVLLATTLGCAAGRVKLPDGATASGLAFGQSKLEFCEMSGNLGTPTSGNAPSGVDTTYLDGPCARIEGGAMSTFMAGLLGAMVSGAVTLFSHGAL